MDNHYHAFFRTPEPNLVAGAPVTGAPVAGMPVAGAPVAGMQWFQN